MNRRAYTLIEMLAWMLCALPVLAAAGAVVASLLRQGPLPDGRTADLACDWLRRDAVAGITVSDGAVIAGSHRWWLRDGYLVRDDRDLLRLRTLTVAVADGVVVLTLQPADRLPARRLELTP